MEIDSVERILLTVMLLPMKRLPSMLAVTSKVPPSAITPLKITPPPSVTVTNAGSGRKAGSSYLKVSRVNPPWQGPHVATGGQLHACEYAPKLANSRSSNKIILLPVLAR